MVAWQVIDGLDPETVETMRLFEAELPAFDGAAVEGRYALLAGEVVEAEVAADWKRIARMIGHLLSFDCWVLSVPMWNFGIPYPLKHYLDLVTQPGLTFTLEPDGTVTGRAAGRTAIIVAAGALDTRPGGPLAALDHQVAFLDHWLRFVGVTDIHVVRVQPTYGSPGIIEAAMAAACADAEAVVAGLCRPVRV